MPESTATLPNTHWHTVAEIIRTRRSNGNVDPARPVPRELVNELIDLAVTAPNHYRTNPFRFVVFSGAARNRLGSLVADVLATRPDQKEAVLERQRVQYLRAPTVIAIASAADEDPVKHFENKYAVAAAAQNILIGAAAAGLAAAWRSGPGMTDPEVSSAVKEALGLAPTDELISFMYLGYPTGAPGAKETPRPQVSYLDA
jgi:nitroreductase